MSTNLDDIRRREIEARIAAATSMETIESLSWELLQEFGEDPALTPLLRAIRRRSEVLRGGAPRTDAGEH